MRRLTAEADNITAAEELSRFTREVLLPADVLPLPYLRAALARGAADTIFGWLRERRSSGLEEVELRLREAGKPASSPDPGSWMEEGVHALAAVTEALREPKEATPAAQTAEPPVRVIFPEGLNPATLGQRTCQGLVFQFVASPDDFDWDRFEHLSRPDEFNPQESSWGSLVATRGLIQDFFLLAQAEESEQVAVFAVRTEEKLDSEVMVLCKRNGQWECWPSLLCRFGNQARLGRPGPERPHARTQELIHRQPLRCTGRDHGPDPFAPAVPTLTARPLRDVPINHHKPYGLFRQIIRRLDSGRGNKREVGFPMLLQALGHRLAVPALGHSRRAGSQNL
jgi:hypothetical protein